jgi:hypothetical protein
MTDKCNHNRTTSTFEKGPHCAICGEPLVSMFSDISRNTLLGAILYEMRKEPNNGNKAKAPSKTLQAQ